MNKINLIILTTTLLLSSCATSYGPKGWDGGYTEMRLGEDTYKVSFHGNSSTESEDVYNYFLRRCAELTKEKGYEYFSFIDQSSAAEAKIGSINNGTSTQYYSATEHARFGIIKMFKTGEQPSVSFSAQEVLKNFN